MRTKQDEIKKSRKQYWQDVIKDTYIKILGLKQPSLRHLVETCIFPGTKGDLPINCPDLLVSFRDFATILIIANECLKVDTIIRYIVLF